MFRFTLILSSIFLLVLALARDTVAQPPPADPPPKIFPKFRPDLVIEDLFLDEYCHVVVRVKNLGPGKVPDEVWTDHHPLSSGVYLLEKGKPWGGASIWKFDPNKALQPPGGTAVYKSSFKVTHVTVIMAIVDKTKQVKEVNENNNSKSKQLKCEAAATGGAALLLFRGLPDIVRLLPGQVKGIDPAVVSLKTVFKKKLGNSAAEIDIVGTVKNIGTKDFKSGKGQQSAYLYEKVPGAKPKVVAKHDFISLPSGEKFTVHYSTTWNTGTEFPPSYRLQIDYDPDIYIDGNANNDDINQKNNSKELKGATITEYVSKMLGN